MNTSKPVFFKTDLILPALSGEKLIFQAKDVFSFFVDPCFIEREITKEGVATPITAIQPYELISHNTFLGAFLDLPGSWEQKILSQNQIIETCTSFAGILSPKDSFTLFLAKKDENLPIDHSLLKNNVFIVMVEKMELFGLEHGLAVLYLEIAKFDLWFAESKIRLIVPKIESLHE